MLDEETQSDKAAANITKENKATEAAPEPPIEKALREVEIEVNALGDKGQALLDSLDDMSKVSHPEIDLARYLKQAAGISKKLHAIKSAHGKKHDAFIANMRSSIEKVMRVLNKCAEKLSEHRETKKPTSPMATGSSAPAAAVDSSEDEDEGEQADATGTTQPASTGSSDEAEKKSVEPSATGSSDEEEDGDEAAPSEPATGGSI